MDPLAKTRRLFLKRISRYGLSLALLAGARPALAKPITTLTGIRISQSAEDHTRVVFDLTGDFEHRLFTLADPYRVVIDLHDTRESQAVDISNTRTNLMNGIRSASKDNGRLRVVLDLQGKVRPRSFELKPDGKSGHRLVVDLHATRLSPTPIQTSQQERKQRKKQFVIALDPGHGGRDPGAIGKKGTREKDVALSVAKKMKNLVNRTPGYRAVLTREGDRFVSLRNRVKKAREAEADIFFAARGLVPQAQRQGRLGLCALPQRREFGSRALDRGKGKRLGPDRWHQPRRQGRPDRIGTAGPVADRHHSGQPRVGFGCAEEHRQGFKAKQSPGAASRVCSIESPGHAVDTDRNRVPV
jgi:N-acetylmuramoyl-L-alanine amidase